MYQTYLKPDASEEAYCKAWTTIASHFVQKCGALGSTLYKANDGRWIAISKWPSAEKRDAVWPKKGDPINPSLPSDVQTAIATLKELFDPNRLIPETILTTVEIVSS